MRESHESQSEESMNYTSASFIQARLGSQAFREFVDPTGTSSSIINLISVERLAHATTSVTQITVRGLLLTQQTSHSLNWVPLRSCKWKVSICL